MSEDWTPLIPILGIFAVPILGGCYMAVHMLRRRHERAQFAEYVDTMPGTRNTSD